MKTVLQIVLDANEITIEDAQKTAKEYVIMKDDAAICKKAKKWAGKNSVKCMRNSESFIVAPRDSKIIDIFDSQIYGFNKTEDGAWKDAAYWLLTGNHI